MFTYKVFDDRFQAESGWNWFCYGGYWSVVLLGYDVWDVSWISWYKGLCSLVFCSKI